MGLTSVRIFLYRNVKIVIACTIVGGMLQVMSRKYIQTHPEFLKNEPVITENDKPVRFISPRGGFLVEFSVIKIVTHVILKFLAEKGLIAGITTGATLLISKIPGSAVTTYLRDAFPQNLPELENRKFLLIDGEKVYLLDRCDSNLKYLLDILQNEEIPFKDRKELAYSILKNYLNLKTPSGRRNFVLCIVFIIYVLSTTGHSSLYIIMKRLIEAIREGKIGKAMGRLIVRRLRKQGVPIDPELAEIVAS